MFLMNEFKAHLSPELIKTHSNPILVSKLDPSELQYFNFPRVKQKELISDREQLTHDQMLVRMIEFAKLAVTGVPDGSPDKQNSAANKKDDIDKLFKFDQDNEKQQVKGPSKLVMSCNMVEVVRIREELIQRIYETDILSCIYKKQLQMLGKGSTKLMLLDPINFDISKVVNDCMNLVDINDGSVIEFDLPFREFDNTLRASLDIRSESCIKALMTDLGVEELRGILHYQIMQQQLLHVAVTINQTIMDGAQKALVELDMLARKKPFSSPNPIINLQSIIQKTTEGNMGETISKERSKYRQILTRDCGEQCYLIDAKKGRLRQPYSHKFSNSILRMSNNLTTEIKLRLLRSQRIKLLHCFCKDVLREVYQDALKAQVLAVNNKLRLQSMLFSAYDNPFTYGIGMIQEPMLSFGFTQGNTLFDKEARKQVEYPATLYTLLAGEAIFYVPSTDEVLQLEPLSRLPLDSPTPGGDAIRESGSPEALIKELVPAPTITLKYHVDEGLIRPFRLVNIADPQKYGGSQTFKVLNYLSLLYRVLKLEYLMMRNSSMGLQVLELEDHVLNGRAYWNTIEKRAGKHGLQDGRTTSERVIQQIINRRKARTNLKEDLGLMSQRLETMNTWLTKTNVSSAELANGKFERLIEHLNIKHAISYRRFIVGIDSIIDTYLDKDAIDASSNPSELLDKAIQVRELLTRKIPAVKRYWENGFNMNQLALQSMFQDFKAPSLSDNLENEKLQQPLQNEESLMPAELELVRSMYNKNVHYEGQISQQALVHPCCRDYSYLENTLLNFKDAQRQYAFTNFMSIDQRVSLYLKFKGFSPKENSLKDCLQGELDYLTLECDSRHLSLILCTMLARSDLPRGSVTRYRQLLKAYKDETVLRVIEERDRLIEAEKARKEARQGGQKKTQEENKEGLERSNTQQPDLPIRKVGPGQLPPGHKVDRESLKDVLSLSDEEDQANAKVQSHHFMTQVFEKRAEITVVKRLLEIKLMSYGASMLQNEHSALLAFLNQAATGTALQLYVSQDQQFAANLSLGNKDPNQQNQQHMDLSNKLSSVQQFLTRLRNRCSEVETLTSGTGIVFSLKDFNECLQMMCRNIVKASEEELRSRVETTALKENMYRHMLYLKEQQVQYYRHKCEHFLQHSDRMVSAKLMQRGSQLLYDLDLTSRELRTLKDNIHVMERMMRAELRKEYLREIQERDDETRKYKESFGGYKDRLNKQVREEVAERIGILKQEVEIMKRKTTTMEKSDEMNTGSTQRSMPNNKQVTALKEEPKDTVEDPTKKSGYYDAEALKEINQLSRHFRRYQLFTRFKEVVTREKHERELYNQRQRLTSNQCLWEQLAECESREALMRQELYFTAQNLGTYEKIVSKLQHQLEVMQSDKMRLVQYKQTTMRQVESMEQKMREVEILENIDLQRVIDELQSRDKKLKNMTVETSQANEKIAQAQGLNAKKLKEMQKKLEQERDLKSQAFSQLEGMRLEIKALEQTGNGPNSSSDNSADLWKQKCKELFDICKDLQQENDDLKTAKTVAVITKVDSKRGSNGVNLDTQLLEEAQHYYSMAPVSREARRDGSSQKRRQGSTDYNTISGSRGDPTTTKPSTAGGGRRGQAPRLLSRGGVASTRLHVQHPWSGHPTLHNQDATLTSGMSLPEILMGQDISDGNGTVSPNSSSLLNQQQRSRFIPHQQSSLMNNPQGIMNSNEIFTIHNNQQNYMNGSATSSDLFQLRGSQKRQNTRGSQGLHLEGTEPLRNYPDAKQSNVPVARSSAGIVFSGLAPPESSHLASMKAMQRGNNQMVQKKGRLMTSQGPRQQRVTIPADQQSTTGTFLSSQVPGIHGHVPSSSNRKSLGGVGVSSATSRGVLSGPAPGAFMMQGHGTFGTSANLAAGLSIANASMPMGPQQVLAAKQQQPISFNINFNTTNISMK